MINRLKKLISKIISEDTAGIKLNYLTLKISDKEVM